MDGIVQMGIDFILSIQARAPWLIPAAAFFTNKVSELFYMVLITAIYWCWNSSLGFRIAMLLMINQGFKSFFKLLFHQPRPFWVDSRVRPFNLETSFGIPSGHAQDATVTFGAIAAWIGKVWAWIAAVLLIFYIGFSRVVIGVHFPTDVVAGWIIGAIILFLYLKLEKPVSTALQKRSTGAKTLIAFLASLALILMNWLVWAFVRNIQIPPTWQQNFQLAFPNEALTPISITSAYSYSGLLFGFCLGVILIQLKGGFNAGGIWWKRILRFLIGISGLAVFYLGLDILFDAIGLGGEELVGNTFRYMRYGMMGLWTTWLAPLIFIKTKLA